MTTSDIVNQLYYWFQIQMRLRREIGELEKQLKAARKELGKTEKEMFALRSTKEYEEEMYSNEKI